LRKTRHERIEKERKDQMFREKKFMTRCIEMRERIKCLKKKQRTKHVWRGLREPILRNKRLRITHA
jgi:hypothetical protein